MLDFVLFCVFELFTHMSRLDLWASLVCEEASWFSSINQEKRKGGQNYTVNVTVTVENTAQLWRQIIVQLPEGTEKQMA